MANALSTAPASGDPIEEPSWAPPMSSRLPLGLGGSCQERRARVTPLGVFLLPNRLDRGFRAGSLPVAWLEDLPNRVAGLCQRAARLRHVSAPPPCLRLALSSC